LVFLNISIFRDEKVLDLRSFESRTGNPNKTGMKMKSKDETDDELRPEYDLTTFLKDGLRGKYAKRSEQEITPKSLSPDAAKAFPTDE